MQKVKQNRYDVMETETVDEKEWMDALSLNLDSFIFNKVKLNTMVRQNDVIRPDIFFYRQMKTNNMEDVVLWLNDIPSRRDLYSGCVLELPAVEDINSYFINNRKV